MGPRDAVLAGRVAVGPGLLRAGSGVASHRLLYSGVKSTRLRPGEACLYQPSTTPLITNLNVTLRNGFQYVNGEDNPSCFIYLTTFSKMSGILLFSFKSSCVGACELICDTYLLILYFILFYIKNAYIFIG
jgi:hypothetical protein